MHHGAPAGSVVNTAAGATWVSIHHGGGVGMGYSQHSGVVIVCDGSEAADKILTEAKMGTRQSPGRLKKDEIAQLHAAMKNVNLSEGQSMQVFRYANRVPLQFQPAACAPAMFFALSSKKSVATGSSPKLSAWSR